MGWLVRYIHSAHMLAGTYTDAGAVGCHSGGSYGHYQQDVNQFARWGFDAIKVDFCGGPALGLDPAQAFGQFAQAIRSDRPRRRMLLNLCNPALWWVPYRDSALNTWSFGPKIATSWRTSTDLSWPGGVSFAHLLRNIDADAAHPEAAGHGHWNDPDYLAPTYFSPTEAQTQFSMWAVLAAPLLVSADVSRLPARTVAMLTNKAVIAISQDGRGIQGRTLAHMGDVQMWVKPLSDGSKAVAILDRGTRTQAIVLSPATIGMHVARMRVTNVWGASTTYERQARLHVTAHETLLLRASP
jgi:alpha-galactosidase